MKSLIFNRNFVLAFALCTVFAMIFVFSSCGKENVTDEQVISYNHEKELIIQDEINSISQKQDIKAAIKISSTDENILALFNSNNTKLKVDYDVITEDENVQDDSEESNLEKVNFESFEKHLKIEVLSILATGEENSITVEFDDEIVSYLEGKNILTEIVFTNVELLAPVIEGVNEHLEERGEWTSGNGYWGPGNFYWFHHSHWAKAAVYRGIGVSTKVTTYHIHGDGIERVLSNKYFKWCHHTYDCYANHYISRGFIHYGCVKNFTLSSNCYRRCP